MKIGELLKSGIKELKKEKINTARIDCEMILSEILRKDKSFLYIHPEKKLTAKQAVFFEKQISKRIKGWPIAYLIKYKEFYGLKFKVNKHTLVPRPETEILIDSAFNFLFDFKNNKKINVYDIGTGSGCIILSFANRLKQNINSFCNFKFIGIDISPKALETAKLNAQKLKLKKDIKFIKGDLLSPIKKFNNNEIHVFLANLPYLTKNQIINSSSIKKEPKMALDGGIKGIKYYRKLIQQIKKLYKNNFIFWAIFEIDPKQAKTLKNIIQSEFGYINLNFIKDYSGKIRFLKFSNI